MFCTSDRIATSAAPLSHPDITLPPSTCTDALAALLCSTPPKRWPQVLFTTFHCKFLIIVPRVNIVGAIEENIRWSTATIAKAPSSRGFILDSFPCPPQQDALVITKDVRDLARRLSYANPDLHGLLMCKGVLKTEDPITKASLLFTFVFKLPESYTDVRSLRSLLTDASPNHSLSARFEVASQIARSVCNVRSFGFVHKNLSPETILVLGNQNTSIGAAYLVGFDRFRTTQGNTARLGDSNWERNLYRHPRRQGASPEDIYIMQHDIYSLGICLLELGLWQSFVEYRALDGLPLRSAALRLQDGTPEMQYPTALKDHLVALARTALPQRMGTKYTEVVQTCLTCLDRENVDFGDEREFQDADGILVGVRYIEKVLMQLSLISV